MKVPGAASPPTVRYLLMSKAPGCTLPLGRRLWPDISVKDSALHTMEVLHERHAYICYTIVCKALFFPHIFGDSSLVQWISMASQSTPPLTYHVPPPNNTSYQPLYSFLLIGPAIKHIKPPFSRGGRTLKGGG